MSLGFSEAEADIILSELSLLWAQLHTADPGAAGTTAIATTTARKQVTLGAGVTTGATTAASNTGALTWTSGEVLATQAITHYSLHTASTAGTFKFSGTVSGSTTSGVEFVIAIGDFIVNLTTTANT